MHDTDTKPRFIVRTVTIAGSSGTPDLRRLLDDEDELLGYDLKHITPINQGGGYTAYLMLIFERKE